jgi:dTDP-4-amino-4,6-dideoxygalactose transaminase
MNEKNIKIPFNKPFIVGSELSNITQAVQRGHLAGDGHYTRLCHTWLEANLGCNKALLTHSCTAALEMSAILCDIKPGDEVIVPSFTFVSTANAFVLRGAVPVFVDIRSDTLNIDESKIEEAISEKTRLIVPVHYAGVPCSMDEIMRIAKKHNLMVVEDAAHALLSTYKGRYLGTIGHLGTLSFHETKNIISGEGGALLVNDEQFIERAEIIREKGTDRARFFRGESDKYSWVDIGSSYLPSELVSAFLCAQMEKAQEIITKRRSLFDLYYTSLRFLAQRGFVRLPYVDDNCASNGHIFYIVTGSHAERTKLSEHLKKCGILAVFHYVPLHSSLAGKQFGKVSGSMIITNNIAERLLRLPMYYEMSEKDIEYVVDSINTFYQKHPL